MSNAGLVELEGITYQVTENLSTGVVTVRLQMIGLPLSDVDMNGDGLVNHADVVFYADQIERSNSLARWDFNNDGISGQWA